MSHTCRIALAGLRGMPRAMPLHVTRTSESIAADATDAHDDDGWHIVKYTDTYAKGEACSGEVIERYKSKERTLVENENGDLEPLSAEEAEAFDPTTLDEGQSWAIETKWGRVHWYAPKTDRHVKRDSSGDFLLTIAGDGNDLKIKGRGNNFFVGVGVKGILQVSGKQKAFAEDFDNEEGGALRYLKVKGHTEQVCHTLGLRAIYNAPNEELYDD